MKGEWKEYFINLNDSSNEGASLHPSPPILVFPKRIHQLSATNKPLGIIHKSRPIFGTQFHPEARGGPLDSSYLFDTYLDSVQQYKRSQAQFQPTRESRPSQMLVDLLAKERVGVAPTTGMANMANMANAARASAAAAAAAA